MNTRKLCCLILGLSASLGSFSFVSNFNYPSRSTSTSFRPDGGGPVPPIPPALFLNRLTVDGGGPVPPIPPAAALSKNSFRVQNLLHADGGGPVPPIPPGSFQIADGGGPVPPIPPVGLSADVLA